MNKVQIIFLSVLQSKLFPTIYLYWQKYQTCMLSKLKAISGGITIAGDGRHDSMGHSAKFGAYTIFCCTIPMIINFVMVQVGTKVLFELYLVSGFYQEFEKSKSAHLEACPMPHKFIKALVHFLPGLGIHRTPVFSGLLGYTFFIEKN